jgi:tetratricopeptide (TPR) repeat protein
MITTTHLRRLLGGAVCLMALSACSTAPVAPTEPLPKPTIADLMGKAAAVDTAGQKEAAMTLWKEAASAYPAVKDPWTRMAQTKYEAGQYGEAIVNAQEILIRDPNDQLANSIIAISGLRLSTRALADLSRQNNLSGSLRTESQDLAKLLRESLGEQVLVPPVREKAAAPAPQPRATGARKATKKVAEPKADPFDALK